MVKTCERRASQQTPGAKRTGRLALQGIVTMASLSMLPFRVARHDTRTALPPPNLPDPHYATAAHRDWRAAVLARAGHACQGCGRRGVRLYADHIVELRDGGAALDVSNGQALCATCHSTKTAAARAARMARRWVRGS